jgi:colicin import membrane protein
MDPSVVAQQDVQRQAQADQAKAAGDAEDRKLSQAAEVTKAQQASQKIAAQQQKDQAAAVAAQQKQAAEAAAEQERLRQEAENSERQHLLDAENVHVNADRNDVTRETAEGQQETELQTTREDNETALEIVDREIAAGKHDKTPVVRNGKGVNK